MSKPNALADLLTRLSVDPTLRRRFQENPEELSREAGLSDEELELVAGGNADRIRNYLGDDAPARCFSLFET
jgi:hypothetical protein